MHKHIPFCSDAHKKKYHAETQRLMILRLAETAECYAKYRNADLRARSTPTGLSPEGPIRPLEQSTAEC
jgi:hypothetical protein